jgi:thioredoxin reductase (NADPH)
VRSIEPNRVIVDKGGRSYPLQNDAVIICAGGLLPTALLDQLGVQVETKYGTA